MFVEIAAGLVSNRGNAIDLKALPAMRQDCVINKKELYRSYYGYDESLLEHLKTYKTVRGYKGKYHVIDLVFDIDKGHNSDEFTLSLAKMFYENLVNDWIDDSSQIVIWFSGRGYHLSIPDIFGFQPSPTLPETVAGTLLTHFPQADNIYDRARLIRVGGTINLKSGLYKIPLTADELFALTPQAIQELAKAPRTGFPFPKKSPVDKLAGEHIVQHREQKLITIGPQPTQIVTCMQKVWAEGGNIGKRHTNGLRLVSSWRRAGIPLDAALTLAQTWAPSLDKEEMHKLVTSVYDKGYTYSCEDAVMKKYCDPSCIYFKRKDYAHQVVDARQMEHDFAKFVRSDFSATSFDLSELFTLKDSYQFFPGEYAIIIGDTKLGKTAWVQNIVTPLKRMKVLYLSLEVHQNLIYRRFVQIAHNMTKQQVVEHYLNNDNKLSSALDHITVMTVSPELSAMQRLIAEVQPRIVVVDTVDGIDVKGVRGGDEVGKSAEIARALKAIAQQQNTIIIGIQHVSKSAVIDSDGRQKRLTVHSGKGSSAAEQKADKIIGIELTNLKNQRFIHSLGARDESGFAMWATMNPDTFIFTQERQ